MITARNKLAAEIKSTYRERVLPAVVETNEFMNFLTTALRTNMDRLGEHGNGRKDIQGGIISHVIGCQVDVSYPRTLVQQILMANSYDENLMDGGEQHLETAFNINHQTPHRGEPYSFDRGSSNLAGNMPLSDLNSGTLYTRAGIGARQADRYPFSWYSSLEKLTSEYVNAYYNRLINACNIARMILSVSKQLQIETEFSPLQVAIPATEQWYAISPEVTTELWTPYVLECSAAKNNQ